ncbi:MAG: response regulator [Deltaproteobacteria bacterium]|nr:MAG: response regulator [Deltaproteobacteria bacterium]
MESATSILAGKTILVVDDEKDILETIEDILDEAQIDTAADYETAAQKIKDRSYDLAILDIMGVNGLELLDKTVSREIPTVMLTAHAVNPDSLMASIRKGAMAYLPKETLSDLDKLLERLLSAHDRGEPPWKLVFEELADYFNERFGPDWKKSDHAFWDDFDRNFQVSRGIQERLLRNRKIIDKGI